MPGQVDHVLAHVFCPVTECSVFDLKLLTDCSCAAAGLILAMLVPLRFSHIQTTRLSWTSLTTCRSTAQQVPVKLVLPQLTQVSTVSFQAKVKVLHAASNLYLKTYNLYASANLHASQILHYARPSRWLNVHPQHFSVIVRSSTHILCSPHQTSIFIMACSRKASA